MGFVGGLPFSTTEEQLKKDFEECGPIEKMNMPKNEEGKAKGIAFITFKTAEGVTAAIKYDGDEYGGRTLKVNKAGEKGDKGKGKGKDGKDGKGKKGNNELTAFVRGLPFSITEDVLRKDFAECGEVVKLRMPLNEEGRPKGIAFIEFSNEEGLKKAIEYDNQEYGGRTINVAKAGDGPS